MSLAKSLCNNLMSEYYEIMAQRIDEYKIAPPRKIGMVFTLQQVNKIWH